MGKSIALRVTLFCYLATESIYAAESKKGAEAPFLITINQLHITAILKYPLLAGIVHVIAVTKPDGLSVLRHRRR